MPKKTNPQRKTERGGLVQRVVTKASKSAKSALQVHRTLPAPIEIEPRPLDSPVLRALRKERSRLLAELRHQEVVEQDHPTTGNHMADDATEVSEQAKTLALHRHLEGMLTEIERAIVRAEKGTYGVCERCKGPISEERLKVMPSATLCIACAKLQTRTARAAA
ncbi:MAG: TraR/DksA C4-type zinc finger protein [Chloroflexi bacterium]|nr:TraR/DksA C4-type zinc finger protein [Chloroflexota bacterium]